MPFEDLLTELPFGLNGRIYRSPLPFSPYFDPQSLVLDAYLEAGVDTVVMLTTVEEVERLLGFNLLDHYYQLGFDVVHAPVDDFSIPSKDGFQVPIEKTLQAARSGKTIAIHCHAGLGRTGMFAACLSKVVLGLDGEAASAWVRQHISGAVETCEQHQFILDFQYSGR